MWLCINRHENSPSVIACRTCGAATPEEEPPAPTFKLGVLDSIIEDALKKTRDQTVAQFVSSLGDASFKDIVVKQLTAYFDTPEGKTKIKGLADALVDRLTDLAKRTAASTSRY